MRKIIALFAASALLFAGCSKAELEETIVPGEEQEEVVASETSFVCSFAVNESAGTKTDITPSGDYKAYYVTWEAGDEITVTNGAKVSVVFVAGTSGDEVEFTAKEETVPEGFFRRGYTYTATYGTDTDNYSVSSGDASHLYMTAKCGDDHNFVFSTTKAVLAVTIPSSVHAKGLKVVTSGDDTETVMTLMSEDEDSDISVFYVPVPAQKACYDFCLYSDNTCGTLIAESMKMWQAQEMKAQTVYRFTFTPTMVIESSGDHFLKSYPADYKVWIKGEYGSADIFYGGSEHPANICVDAKGHSTTDLTITTADSHVTIENGDSDNVSSTTSSNSLVIKPTYKINEKLTLNAGSVYVEGTEGAANVAMIEIPAGTADVKISINTVQAGKEKVHIVNKSLNKVEVVGVEGQEYTLDGNPIEEVSAVAVIGSTRYTSLESAVAAALDGETVLLLADISLKAQLEISGKSITIDLAGHKISYSGSTTITAGLIAVHNGAGLTVNDTTGSGKIEGGNNTYAGVSVTFSGESDALPAALTVNGGTIEGSYYGIAGNGSRHNTEITINGGAVRATATDDSEGIYHPQNGTLTITGGTVEGCSGIYMKSGSMAAFTGGTIKGTGAKKAYKPIKSGCEATGDALIIDNCSYPGGEPSATIAGATLISENGYQVGAYYNSPETTISDIYSTDCTLTAPESYVWLETGTAGTYKLSLPTVVEVDPTTVQDALDAAADGITILLKAGDYGHLYLRNAGENTNRIFKDITIAAASGEDVTVEQIEYQKASGKYLDVENLTISGITFDLKNQSAVLFDVDGGHSVRVNGLIIQNCKKEGDKSEGSGESGKYDHAAFIDLCYDGDTATGATYAGDPSLTCGYHNIVVRNNTITKVFQPIKVPNSGPLYGMTISGNTFDDCQDNHMMLSSKTGGKVIVKDNVIRNMTGRFARISGAVADAAFELSGNKVETPKTYDTGGDGSIFKISGTAGFTVSQSDNEWEDGDFTDASKTTWIAMGKASSLPVAKIGETYYGTLAAAVAAAKAGSDKTITIVLTGDYSLPGDVSGLTIQADEDVVATFTVTTGNRSIAKADNATLKGLKFILPTANYSGFYESDATFDGCSFEGLLTTYQASSKQTFKNCSFKSSGNNYSVNAYSSCSFTGCHFTTDEGKAIYLYTEGLASNYSVDFDGCTFTKTGSDASRKPAILVKTRTSGLYTDGYNVTIKDCTATGFADFKSKDDDVYDYDANGLWGIETKSGDDLTYTGTYLTVDGTLVYPHYYPDATTANLHHIISAKGLKAFRYEINENKINYAGHTVQLDADIDLNGETWTPIACQQNEFGTFDGNDHKISNYVVNVTGGDKHAGLFSALGCGTVKDLSIYNADVTGINHVGALVGYGICAKFENCKVYNSTVTSVVTNNDDGDKAGAICGYLSGEGVAYARNCHVENCTITAYRDLAAVVGIANKTAEVTGCTAKDVKVICKTGNNYKGYSTESEFDANQIVGETSASATVTDNTATNVTVSYDPASSEVKGDTPGLGAWK